MTVYREGSSSRADHVREFKAPTRGEAVAACRSWLLVEGYDVDRSMIDVVADGMTLADHVVRELTNLGDRMAQRHGVSTDGPRKWVDPNDRTHASVRLFMPNGRGVSVSSHLNEFGSVRSEYAAVRKDATDRHGWVFDKSAQHYPDRTTVGDGFDGDVSQLLTRIADLPQAE